MYIFPEIPLVFLLFAFLKLSSTIHLDLVAIGPLHGCMPLPENRLQPLQWQVHTAVMRLERNSQNSMLLQVETGNMNKALQQLQLICAGVYEQQFACRPLTRDQSSMSTGHIPVAVLKAGGGSCLPLPVSG